MSVSIHMLFELLTNARSTINKSLHNKYNKLLIAIKNKSVVKYKINQQPRQLYEIPLKFLAN